jgi:hypothetical protein
VFQRFKLKGKMMNFTFDRTLEGIIVLETPWSCLKKSREHHIKLSNKGKRIILNETILKKAIISKTVN